MVPLGSLTSSMTLTLRLGSFTSCSVRLSLSLTVLMDWKGNRGHNLFRNSGFQQ